MPFDGANKYSLHFDKGALPPVDAFWSVTLYDPEGYQVANPLNRFAVSSWMPIKYDPDGSLTLYFQSESPRKDKEANWLPAPKGGGFNLLMRLYAPRSEVLTGKWNPPPVTKTEAFMGISGRPPHVLRLRRSPYGTSMPRAGGRGRDGDRSVKSLTTQARSPVVLLRLVASLNSGFTGSR